MTSSLISTSSISAGRHPFVPLEGLDAPAVPPPRCAVTVAGASSGRIAADCGPGTPAVLGATHENECARVSPGFDTRFALLNQQRRHPNTFVPLEGLEPDMHPRDGAGEGRDPSVLLGFLTAQHCCDQVDSDSSAVKMQSRANPAR